MVWYARFCTAKRQWMEHSIEGHEIRDGNDVEGLYVGEGTHVGTEFSPEASISVGMGDSWWEE